MEWRGDLLLTTPRQAGLEKGENWKNKLQCGHSNHERYGFIFALFVLFFFTYFNIFSQLASHSLESIIAISVSLRSSERSILFEVAFYLVEAKLAGILGPVHMEVGDPR